MCWNDNLTGPAHLPPRSDHSAHRPLHRPRVPHKTQRWVARPPTINQPQPERAISHPERRMFIRSLFSRAPLPCFPLISRPPSLHLTEPSRLLHVSHLLQRSGALCLLGLRVVRPEGRLSKDLRGWPLGQRVVLDSEWQVDPCLGLPPRLNQMISAQEVGEHRRRAVSATSSWVWRWVGGAATCK